MQRWQIDPKETCLRVCICTGTSWTIIRLPCGIPAIHIGTIAELKAELADAFLYPYSHNCMSNGKDWLSARVHNANHHPRQLISQKSQIARLIRPGLTLWCDCANSLLVSSAKYIFGLCSGSFLSTVKVTCTPNSILFRSKLCQNCVNRLSVGYWIVFFYYTGISWPSVTLCGTYFPFNRRKFVSIANGFADKYFACAFPYIFGFAAFHGDTFN